MFRQSDETQPNDENDEFASSWGVVLVRIGKFGLKCLAVLVAAIVAIEWYVARTEIPTDHGAMHLLRGEAGVGSKSLRVSADGRTFATTDTYGRVALWDGNQSWSHTTLVSHGGFARTTTFSPDGRFLVAAGSHLTLWDLENNAEEQTISVPVNLINCVEFSPDGHTLAMAPERECEVIIVDLNRRDLASEFLGAELPIRCLAFSPDGKFLATGDNGGTATITVWDLAKRSPVLRLRHRLGPLKTIMFSPDGTSLASAHTYERGIRIWDISSGRMLQTFAGHHLGTNSLAFSPDGSVLATGGGDGVVRLWNVATGDLLSAMDAQSIGLLSVAFLRDGRSLAAAGFGDNDIRIWDLQRSKLDIDSQLSESSHSSGPLLGMVAGSESTNLERTKP
jgi:WD40 repeat protein